jgi:hypothetical protein
VALPWILGLERASMRSNPKIWMPSGKIQSRFLRARKSFCVYNSIKKQLSGVIQICSLNWILLDTIIEGYNNFNRRLQHCIFTIKK